MNNPLEKLARIAEAEVGNHEEPRGSNRGPALDKYFRADDLVPGRQDNGYAWCASFVDWCVQKFLRDVAGLPYSGVTPPRTAQAFALEAWGRENGCLLFTPAMCKPAMYWPQRGDIAVYAFSHVGIVTVAASRERIFTAVEGNTDSAGSREGWEVARKGRVFGSVRRFIRLSPRAKVIKFPAPGPDRRAA